MVRGCTLERVVEELHAEYEADDVNAQLDGIEDIYNTLRTTSHFRPVLRA
jgi:hypothetical protein